MTLGFGKRSRRGSNSSTKGKFLTHEEVGERLKAKFQSQMDIRWSENAAQDLEDIYDFNWSSSPAAAQRAAETIYRRANDLVEIVRVIHGAER